MKTVKIFKVKNLFKNQTTYKSLCRSLQLYYFIVFTLIWFSYLEKGKEKTSNLWTCLCGHRPLQEKNQRWHHLHYFHLTIKGAWIVQSQSCKKAQLKNFLWIADRICSKQEDIPIKVGQNPHQMIKNKLLCKGFGISLR